MVEPTGTLIEKLLGVQCSESVVAKASLSCTVITVIILSLHEAVPISSIYITFDGEGMIIPRHFPYHRK